MSNTVVKPKSKTMDEINQTREPDTEIRILAAAGKVFMLKGKLGASMQDIADEAGINRTLLHYYFRSKDKLFNTIFEKTFARIFPAMLGIVSSDRPFQERIEDFVNTYSNILRENPYLPIFIFQEISLNPDRILDVFKGTGFHPNDTLKEFKAELTGSGMEDVDPRHFFASLMGMILFPFMGRPIYQAVAFEDNPEAYEQFISERTKHIPEFIKMAFNGARTQQDKK